MDTNRAVTSTLLFVFFSLLFSNVRAHPSYNTLRSVYSWKALEFAFPSEEARESAISLGDFVPGSPMPLDVDTFNGARFGKRIFVTIPRFQKGVPVTLGYVVDNVAVDGEPLIAPYPNWEWQRANDCEALTSVWRIEIDRCGRMWVMDTGKIEETQVCPPQLLMFSLETEQLVSRYRLPKSNYRESSLFVTPIVDARGPSCEDTFVYIADVSAFAIVVYDHQHQRSWKISNNLFYPYPNYGTFYIKDHVFDLMDGILGMTLSPLRNNEDRILYFHSLASRVESYVATSVLRNHSIFESNAEASPRSFVAFPNERSSQSAAEAMDKNGVMYFGIMSELAIGCWNSMNYDYGDEYIERIATDADTLQFASGVKVITAKSGRQELWVMTISFQRIMTGTLSSNETNFRIQAAVVDELVRGTKCDVASININLVRESAPSSSGTLTFPK